MGACCSFAAAILSLSAKSLQASRRQVTLSLSNPLTCPARLETGSQVPAFKPAWGLWVSQSSRAHPGTRQHLSVSAGTSPEEQQESAGQSREWISRSRRFASPKRAEKVRRSYDQGVRLEAEGAPPGTNLLKVLGLGTHPRQHANVTPCFGSSHSFARWQNIILALLLCRHAFLCFFLGPSSKDANLVGRCQSLPDSLENGLIK